MKIDSHAVLNRVRGDRTWRRFAEELSEVLGVTISHQSVWEWGTNGIPAERVPALLKISADKRVKAHHLNPVFGKLR